MTADELVANEIRAASDPVERRMVDARWLTDPVWVEQQRVTFEARLAEMAAKPEYDSPWAGVENFPTRIAFVPGTMRCVLYIPRDILARVKPKLSQPYRRGSEVHPEEIAKLLLEETAA